MAGANSVGTLSITVAGNASPLIQEFAKTRKAVEQTALSVASFKPSGVGIGQLAGAMIPAVAAGNLLSDGIKGVGSMLSEATFGSVKLAAEFEKAGVAFEVLTGNAAVGKKTLTDLQNLATDTPFSSRGLIDYGRSLLGMGARAEQLVPILSRLGDVAQGNDETLGRLVLQFGQVLNSGSFKKEEFNVFAEAGADVQAFAKAAGKSMQELNAAFERGEVGADVMVKGFNAMTSEGGRFFNMNAKMSATFDGQLNSFLEKLDLFRIKVGTAFLQGFKPGAMLENLANQFSGLDGIEAKLIPMFERVRVIFDRVAAGAGALASVIGQRLGASLGILGEKGAWDNFEKGADSAVQAVLIGVGGLIKTLGKFKNLFADTIRMMANAAVKLVPDREKEQFKELENILNEKGGGDGILNNNLRAVFVGMRQEAGNAIWGAVGGSDAMNAAREAANQFKIVGNEIADAVGQANWDMTAEILAEHKRLMGIMKKDTGDSIRNNVGEIALGTPQMSKKASDFLNSAIAKPPSEFEQFKNTAALANEAARFRPEASGAAFNKLASEFMALQKNFLGGMEVRLPQALKAGSSEAESIITAAMTQREQGQDRVEAALKQIRDINDRQEQQLKKIAKGLEKINFQAVGF
jgi:tape measure domain-containing protein